MTKINYRILFFLLIIFSTYCAIIVCQSWDERFHLTQGKIVLEYFFSLGNVKKDILHREFYSPIYWTINHFLTLIFPLKYQIQISHLINLVLS